MELEIVGKPKRGAKMAIVRTASLLDIIKKAYEGNGDFVVLGLQVRSSQRELLKELSTQSGESQASILRAIIDEWCEIQLARQMDQA